MNDPYNKERQWAVSIDPHGWITVHLSMSKEALQHWIDHYDEFGKKGLVKKFRSDEVQRE